MRYDKYGLTVREREIYEYIIKFKIINGYPPTFREIADGVNTSRSFVRKAVQNLEQKGFLKYNETKRRSLCITKII